MKNFSARRAAMAGLGACLAVTGCASGRSIVDAGNDRPATTLAPSTTPSTAAQGGAPSATTIPLGAATTIALGAATTIPLSPTTIALPRGFMSAPPPPDYAPCPVDALDEADGPVEITFWYAMATPEAQDTLTALTDAYNASQDRVVVELQNQSGYDENADKFLQSGIDDRPNIVQLPEYRTQQMADLNAVVPIGACIQTEGYDISPILPRTLLAFQTGGVQWSMPFNASDPVLYYNKLAFAEAGLDPEKPPVTLEELREYSQQIVDSGAATYGIALDNGVNSGGGWFLEQWLARAGLPYADNQNGRQARATGVVFDTPETVELLTGVQDMVTDGLAVNVGDNTSGFDVLLQVADPEQPAAMGIATSGALGTALAVLGGGQIEGFTADDLGVGPMPGPSDTPAAIVGGASLYITRDKGDPATAASWDYIKFLISAESQATWGAATGYVPIRSDATELEPLATTYADDPRFRVAYDQLTTAADDFSAVGPVLGPLRQVREVTARMMAEILGGADVQTSLTSASDQANLLITDYNNRN